MDSYHTILGPCWPLGLALTLGLGYGSTAPVFFCFTGWVLMFFLGGGFFFGGCFFSISVCSVYRLLFAMVR